MSPVSNHPLVTSLEGVRGWVESEMPEDQAGDLNVLVSFENGERLCVPAQSLILQPDGNFQITLSLADLAGQHTRPTIAARPAELEQAPDQGPVSGAQPEVNNGQPPEERLEEPYFPEPDAEPAASMEHVQLSRIVESYREEVGASLLREEVEIHRVPVNEFVTEAPPIRYEGDRIIIPVLEEVLHVEKRVLVKEEVVITKHRAQVAAEQRELRQATDVIAAPTAEPGRAFDPKAYRQHYEAQRYPGARSFAYYEPAYRFGAQLRYAPRYAGWAWDQLEPEARALWERDNPGTWTRIQPAVRHAWDRPEVSG